jgi:hypothetical protein
MGPLFEKCAELGMPVSIHVGEPKWMYEKMDSTNDGLMNSYEWRLDDQDFGYHWPLHALALSDKVLENIYHSNFIGIISQK